MVELNRSVYGSYIRILDVFAIDKPVKLKIICVKVVVETPKIYSATKSSLVNSCLNTKNIYQ